jgi:hypothetical protein
MLEKHRLYPLHDSCGLHSMRIGADGEVHVSRSDAKIAKESVGEHVVVVLSRVDDDLRQAGRAAGSLDRCEFREVRPGTNYMQELHLNLKCKCDAASVNVTDVTQGCRKSLARCELR